MNVSRSRGQLVRAVAVAWVAAAAPAGATAQEDLGARLRAAYGAEAAGRIEAVAERARASGVPAGPLLQKALEGAAKNVPLERVLPVLSAYADRLEAAAKLYDGSPDPDGLVAAAEAIRRGVPETTIADMVRGRPDGGPASLVVLADLVEAGVPVDLAGSIVKDAMAGGVKPDALLELPGAVHRQIRSGRTPADAARAAAAAANAAAGAARGGPPSGVGRGSAPGRPPVPPGQTGRGRRGGG